MSEPTQDCKHCGTRLVNGVCPNGCALEVYLQSAHDPCPYDGHHCFECADKLQDKEVEGILELFQLEVESWNIGTPTFKTLTKAETAQSLETHYRKKFADEIDAEVLEDVCREYAEVRSEDGEDYMGKWFSRNSERLIKQLIKEVRDE